MKSERATYRLCSTGDLLVLMRETRGSGTGSPLSASFARERTAAAATANQSTLYAQPLGCAVSLSSQRIHSRAVFLSLGALSVPLAHAICFELSLWPLWLPYARRSRRQRCRSGGVAYHGSSASHWGFMPVLWLIFGVRRSNSSSNSNCN